jgi:hypothetical protein
MNIGPFNNIGRARIASRQGIKLTQQSPVFQDPLGNIRLGILPNRSAQAADRPDEEQRIEKL